jgi:hypothetical protein
MSDLDDLSRKLRDAQSAVAQGIEAEIAAGWLGQYAPKTGDEGLSVMIRLWCASSCPGFPQAQLYLQKAALSLMNEIISRAKSLAASDIGAARACLKED